MTETSRRGFLRTTVLGGAVAGGAVLLPTGRALAAEGCWQPDPGRQDCGCSTEPGVGGPGATELQLQIVNNSSQFQDMCVYQQPVGLEVPGGMPLAWLTEPAFPTTIVTFRWTTSYDFVWGVPGTLAPGTTFTAQQIWDANPTEPNLQQVLFDYAQGAFTFVRGPVAPVPQPGSLYIKESPAVPPNAAAVGIGMSGAGTFVVPAMPNIDLVFTPHPNYWITAGTFQPGQVLDIEEISNTVPVVFPPGVFSMVAILGADNTWTLRPGTV